MKPIRYFALAAVVGTGALVGSAVRGEEGGYDPSRSRLIVVPEGPESGTPVDAYDDLGDFVATWDVRLATGVGTPKQVLQYGRLTVTRRDGWLNLVMTMQQPRTGEDGRIEDQHWIQEAWIFHEGRCEGHVMNGGLTVDPTNVAPSSGMLDPLFLGLGVVFHGGYGEGDPTRLVFHSESEAKLREWCAPDVVEPGRSAEGLVTSSRERAQGREIPGGGNVRHFTRTAILGGEGRKRALSESGLRLHSGNEVHELLLSSSRVLRWADKLPAEIEGREFSRVPLDFASVEGARETFERGGSESGTAERLETEYRLTLLNVRNATAADRVTMKDWEDAVVGIEFGPFRGQYQDVRTSTPEGGTAVAWRVEPTSQRWVQGTP